MRVAIVIEVDDERLAEYVRSLASEYAADGGTDAFPDAQEWLRERIQAVADDELRVALWGWTDKLGMDVVVTLVELDWVPVP